MEGNIPC